MVLIRVEQPSDHRVVADLVKAAFCSALEARMIDAIRASPHYVRELSLVATEDDVVVGHVMLSYVTLEPSESEVLQLGPMAVTPARQRQGIGSKLVRAALAAADERGEPLVLVLGHPDYYPRFGFRPSRELGIEPPDPAFQRAFMAAPLSAHTLSLTGRVVLSPALAMETDG